MKYILDSKDGNFHTFIREGKEEDRLVLANEQVKEVLHDGDVVEIIEEQGNYQFTVLDQETEDRLNRSKSLIEKLRNK